MHRSISKRDDSKKFSIEFPKYSNSAIICGLTSCGKTMFVLYLLEFEYKDVFENIVILCPTIKWNKTYKTGDGLVMRRTQKTNI